MLLARVRVHNNTFIVKHRQLSQRGRRPVFPQALGLLQASRLRTWRCIDEHAAPTGAAASRRSGLHRVSDTLQSRGECVVRAKSGRARLR